MKREAVLGALFVAAGASAAQGAPFDWTGFYTGIHAGYGAGQEHDNQSQIVAAPAPSGPGGTTATTTGSPTIINDQFDLGGFIGGVHAGFDYQLDPLVVGIGGDLDYSGADGRHDGVYQLGTQLRRLSFESRWQGSLRLRAGFTPLDRLLLYATGGVAIADGRVESSGSENGIPIPSTTSTRRHIGWTAGGGADYAFTDHWVGRAEVRYSDFGRESYSTHDGPLKVDWSQVTGSIGFGYKF